MLESMTHDSKESGSSCDSILKKRGNYVGNNTFFYAEIYGKSGHCDKDFC